MYKQYTKNEYDRVTRGMNATALVKWMRGDRQGESDALNVARAKEIEASALNGEPIAKTIYDNRKNESGHKGRDSKGMAKACEALGKPFNGNIDGTPSSDDQFGGEKRTIGEQACASRGEEPSEADAKLQALQELLGGGADEDKVREMAQEEAQKVAEKALENAIKPIVVNNEFDQEVVTIENTHSEFAKCLRTVRVHGRALLHGDKGTGKSQIVKGIAEALGYGDNYRIVSCTSESSIYDLVGCRDANGKFHTGAVLEAYEGGMLLFLDEFDSLDPSTGVALNALLEANTTEYGVGQRTAKPLAKRGDGFLPMLAVNTLNGMTNDYTGRMKQDGATLSRFPSITRVHVDYCKALESRILGSAPKLAERLWSLRQIVRDQQLIGDCMPTTRDFASMALEVAYRDSDSAKANGDGMCDDALIKSLVSQWSPEEYAKVKSIIG